MTTIVSFPPYSMIDRYANLTVETDDGTFSATIDEYRCVKKFTFGARGCDDALDVKDGFLGLGAARDFGGAVNLVDCFTGKASPETFEQGLAAVYKHRRAFIAKYDNSRSSEPRRRGVGILKSVDAGMLARFAREFMGLDCNGFVGNYLKRFSPLGGLGPQHDPGQWYKTIKTLGPVRFRKQVSEFQIGDALVSTVKAHIGVIDEPTMPGMVDIAQSGGRLFYSSHDIRPTTAKEDSPTFLIDHPDGGFGGCPTVWVMRAATGANSVSASAFMQNPYD